MFTGNYSSRIRSKYVWLSRLCPISHKKNLIDFRHIFECFNNNLKSFQPFIRTKFKWNCRGEVYLTQLWILHAVNFCDRWMDWWSSRYHYCWDCAAGNKSKTDSRKHLSVQHNIWLELTIEYSHVFLSFFLQCGDLNID